MTYYTYTPDPYQSIATQAANMLAYLRDNGLLRAHSQRTDSTGADLLPRQLDDMAEEVYEDMTVELKWDYSTSDWSTCRVASWEHASIPTRHCVELIAALQWAVQTRFTQQVAAGEEIS